jgi:hypothetical protein
MNYKSERLLLKSQKREAMKRDFKSSKERKNVRESFNAQFRSLKRSEKNKVKLDIKKEFGV